MPAVPKGLQRRLAIIRGNLVTVGVVRGGTGAVRRFSGLQCDTVSLSGT